MEAISHAPLCLTIKLLRKIDSRNTSVITKLLSCVSYFLWLCVGSTLFDLHQRKNIWPCRVLREVVTWAESTGLARFQAVLNLNVTQGARSGWMNWSILGSIFWVVAACSDVMGDQRFGEPWYLHLQGERLYPTTSLHGIISHKTATRIFRAVTISSLATDWFIRR
jgi:hypothetical protein